MAFESPGLTVSADAIQGGAPSWLDKMLGVIERLTISPQKPAEPPASPARPISPSRSPDIQTDTAAALNTLVLEPPAAAAQHPSSNAAPRRAASVLVRFSAEGEHLHITMGDKEYTLEKTNAAVDVRKLADAFVTISAQVGLDKKLSQPITIIKLDDQNVLFALPDSQNADASRVFKMNARDLAEFQNQKEFHQLVKGDNALQASLKSALAGGMALTAANPATAPPMQTPAGKTPVSGLKI